MVYFVMQYTDYKRRSLHSECHTVSRYTQAISFRPIRKIRSILGQFLRKSDAQQHELGILHTRRHPSRRTKVENRRGRNSFAFPTKIRSSPRRFKKKKARSEIQHICVKIFCDEFYQNRTRKAQNRATLHLSP
jgi:hypothetical protein